MSAKARWSYSIAAGLAAVPASYAAGSLMLCSPTAIGRLIGLANALTLIP